jgi:hypothetical protein
MRGDNPGGHGTMQAASYAQMGLHARGMTRGFCEKLFAANAVFFLEKSRGTIDTHTDKGARARRSAGSLENEFENLPCLCTCLEAMSLDRSK